MGSSVRLTRRVGTREPYSFKTGSRTVIEVNGREVFMGNKPSNAVAVNGHFHLPGEPCPLIKAPRNAG